MAGLKFGLKSTSWPKVARLDPPTAPASHSDFRHFLKNELK